MRNAYFYRMMRWLLFTFISFIFIIASCTKDGFITGKEAFLFSSDTAVHFDTVFTSAGSVTKPIKLFNINEQKLRISNLQLLGGNASFFKINLSGTPGTQFSNVDIDKGDSLYIFVSVTINPDGRQLPFIIEDSIRIDYNGNTQYVKLDAYGQNAHFLRSAIITQNTTWTNDLPYVLMDTFAVANGAVLTIEKGAKVFCHANTPFTVEGSLQVNGTDDSTGAVTFLNDRLDVPYSHQPGTWNGIYFAPQSRNNVLNYTVIKNALQGIAADQGSFVTLNGCTIDNCAETGLIAYNSSVSATNCLFANSSYNLYAIAGGHYTFTHCTIAAYSTLYLFHQYPALTLSNSSDDGSEANLLQTVLQNCIVYGEDDEVFVRKDTRAPLMISFENTLYKSPTANSDITYQDCLPNADPLFAAIDKENNLFDFHLSAQSPCIDAGKKTGTLIDLDGKLRSELPDLGCYEFHE